MQILMKTLKETDICLMTSINVSTWCINLLYRTRCKTYIPKVITLFHCSSGKTTPAVL